MGETMMRFFNVTPRTVSGVSMGNTARGVDRLEPSEVGASPRAGSAPTQWGSVLKGAPLLSADCANHVSYSCSQVASRTRKFSWLMRWLRVSRL